MILRAPLTAARVSPNVVDAMWITLDMKHGALSAVGLEVLANEVTCKVGY